MKTLVIVRHGNTFETHEKPRRIGTTDIPLTSFGKQQIEHLSKNFQQQSLHADILLCSPLLRTQQTAMILQQNTFPIAPIIKVNGLAEINYGPDENALEEDVIARLGPALSDWNLYGIMPHDWPETVESIYSRWDNILYDCLHTYTSASTIFLVTSNGLARFLPRIIGSKKSTIKALKTAHYGIITYHKSQWHISCWNHPEEHLTLVS